MSFCGFIKEISPKMCVLCVRVQINKRSFELFVFGSLFTEALNTKTVITETERQAGRRRDKEIEFNRRLHSMIIIIIIRPSQSLCSL